MRLVFWAQNGSGKSTLLRIMLGFLKFEGTVNICG
nr:hypothetical protein [Campylobacter showae]